LDFQSDQGERDRDRDSYRYKQRQRETERDRGILTDRYREREEVVKSYNEDNYSTCGVL